VISRRIRTTSAAAALFTAVAVGVPAAARAAAPASADNAATAAVTVTPASSGAAAVVLPTGDRVTVGLGAHAGLAVDQSPGGSGSFAGLKIGGDQYVIPAEAAPYVGRSLDLSLFDVTKMAAAGATANTHIPVQLSFAAGVTPSAPAGVTFTSVSGQSAAGYLTPDSGKAFAQALRDSIKADIAAGKKAGTGALFGGLTSMAASGATPPVHPFYPLHILTLNTLDNTGAPSDASVILVNTDNAQEFNGEVSAYQGVAKVAVPAGNYAAFSVDFLFDPTGNTTRLDFVSQDGITVPATGTVPVATIDERSATSPVTFTTQKPSTEDGGFLQVTRISANGGGAGVVLFGGPGQTTYVSPEAKPAIGSLDYVLNWIGTSPATAASPYRYNLGVTSDHIDANQSYAPTDRSLATLKHTFELDPAGGANLPSIGSGFLTPDGWGLSDIPATGPSVTEYLTSGLQWFSQLELPQVPDPTGQRFSFATLGDDPVLYHAGQVAARTWARAPLAPNVGQHPAQTSFFGCQACAAAGNLVVVPGMLGDSNRDTTGIDFTAAGTSQLYVNGTLVSSDTNQYGYLVQNLPAGPATVRTVFDFDRTGDGASQSSKTHTDLTVPYSGQTDPHLTLPSTVSCDLVPPTPGTPPPACQILPALTLNYQLNGLDGKNTSHSPIQSLVLNVGHLSYGGVGSRAHIDSAQVSVSFDNGATWKNVPTHGADGVYAALWANPAAGSPIELKVTATDCLGGSITQTITNPDTVG
jgi:hypothetical protein